ncbi:MAG: M23 family metallopeptidase [Clostridia bacterium]|nr:M23 family metallopeptidase [Clostridia bacterium]MBQ8792722.1 M23 family metallopeptidase [Clostridia bacterium]
MEIGKKNRFVEFMKSYWLYVVVGAMVFAMAVMFTVLASINNTIPTSTTPLQYYLPMTDAYVLKDYSDSELQINETLNQWEAHLSVDLASENGEVCAILDGIVTSIDYNVLEGNLITITHSNGLVTTYGSLADDISLKVGDSVKGGDKIGQASDSATGELDLGQHLCLTMKLNNKYVDPNLYLDLQAK